MSTLGQKLPWLPLQTWCSLIAELPVRECVEPLIFSGGVGAIGRQHSLDLAAFLGGNAMKLPRRKFLHLAVGAAALPVISRVARAQTYPSRPVRIVAGFPAGSLTDIVARLIGQWLQERLDQPFIIENRPGSAGNIAIEAVARATPDGHTLIMVGSSLAINATLYDNLKYNLTRDIAPISAFVSVPNVLVVNPSVLAKTIPELIAYAKANPGKLNMASGGIGSSGHLAGELFKMMTGVNLMHVPYRGSPAAMTDLLGGQVQLNFSPITGPIEHIRAGTLRALAVTSATHSDALPDIPTVGEFVPGYEASTWIGIGAPRNTPGEIIRKLNEEISAGVGAPKIRAAVADFGGTPLAGSPADFSKLIAEEIEKWGKVIRAAKIKA
jgi:tripartite-type tricarboxylate transporter receptor subunit TctC